MNDRNAVFFCLVLLEVLLTALFFSPKVSGQTQGAYSFDLAFPNLTFSQPDGLVTDPTNQNRLFVIEQAGVIKVFQNNRNATVPTVFLNITDKVLYGGEDGLLGLAFHPNFTQNRYFYINYVTDNPRRTIIARYTVLASNPNVVDTTSEQTVLSIDQPFSNHKAGQLTFGPDSNLYIGLGDGGSEGDPLGNGQNLTTLLGKILRINVNSAVAGRNYTIPRDNPFVGNTQGFYEEIYAYGFRNPWRFSFDPKGQLWVGDVGQDRLEEIDLVEKGKNYGWSVMEGTLCFNPSYQCNQTGLELPVWNYTHDLGNSVIGGFVYSGSSLPSLAGAYVYGDFGSGRIWALKYNGTAATNVLLVDTGLNIASFGLDQHRELYFTAYDGKIYKLTSTAIPEFPWQAGLVFFLAVTLAVTVCVKRMKHFRLMRQL